MLIYVGKHLRKTKTKHVLLYHRNIVIELDLNLGQYLYLVMILA